MALFSGLFAAAVTPRRPDSASIDLASYWELLDFLGSFPIDGIVLMGSTGEFLHFDLEERTKYLGLTVKRSRKPVLVNVTHSTLDASLEIADAAARAKVAGVLLSPPYYFRYSEADIVAWFRGFARSKPKIPALLYQIPQFANSLSADSARAVLADGCYEGMKDSSGVPEYFHDVAPFIAERGGSYLTGNDGHIATTLGHGATGVVSGCACAVPELLLALHTSILNGDATMKESASRRLSEFLERIDAFPVPVGIREALRVRGLKVGPAAMPFDSARQRELDAFCEWFRDWLREVRNEVPHG
jgi:dihydrodipicolinate synthase/N-acetylneuraminate lyase